MVTISLITLLLISDLAVTFFVVFFVLPLNLILPSSYRYEIQRCGLWFNLLNTVISVSLICEVLDSVTDDLLCVSAGFVREEIILKCRNKNVSKFMICFLFLSTSPPFTPSFHCGETFACVICVSFSEQNLRTGNVSDRRILDCRVKTKILCLTELMCCSVNSCVCFYFIKFHHILG